MVEGIAAGHIYPPVVGVISFQGDFDRHVSILTMLGARSVRVRRVSELHQVDGLIIPGGESTTIGKLMDRFDLLAPVRSAIEQGLPVMGTCAGAILLAREIEESDQIRLGTMDIRVRRNAYGRQVDSFDAPLTIDPTCSGGPSPETGGAESCTGVFIRAPRITAIGDDVRTVARLDGEPVAVQSGATLALTFHPELTGDTRFHRRLLEIVRDRSRERSAEHSKF